MEVLDVIVEPALAVTAVLAAIGAVIASVKKTWRWWRNTARPFIAKVDVVLDLAAHELQPNSGSSIKDAADRIPELERKVDEHIAQSAHHLEQGRKAQEGIEGRLTTLESQQADTVAHLAEALPVIARAVPHPVDAHLPTSPDPTQEAS